MEQFIAWNRTEKEHMNLSPLADKNRLPSQERKTQGSFSLALRHRRPVRGIKRYMINFALCCRSREVKDRRTELACLCSLPKTQNSSSRTLFPREKDHTLENPVKIFRDVVETCLGHPDTNKPANKIQQGQNKVKKTRSGNRRHFQPPP